MEENMVCTKCGKDCRFRAICSADGTVRLCWDCSDEETLRAYGFEVGLKPPPKITRCDDHPFGCRPSVHADEAYQ